MDTPDLIKRADEFVRGFDADGASPALAHVVALYQGRREDGRDNVVMAHARALLNQVDLQATAEADDTERVTRRPAKKTAVKKTAVKKAAARARSGS